MKTFDRDHEAHFEDNLSILYALRLQNEKVLRVGDYPSFTRVIEVLSM